MKNVVLTIFLFIFASCANNLNSEYNLPEECGDKCEKSKDLNSFYDAAVNSSAAFSNCICLESGVFEGVITVAKPLKIIGKKDGSSILRQLNVRDAKDVFLSDFSISNLSVDSAAINVFSSDVVMENISLSNVKASSLIGGRGIVISGESSNVKIRNSKLRRLDGTGLLINGSHNVSLDDVEISQCGFAAVWAQNYENKTGNLEISNSSISENGAVSVEILGNSSLKILDTTIKDVKKREMALATVGDALVVKNSILSREGALLLENTNIDGFVRAGVILDGQNAKSVSGVKFNGLKIVSDEGDFGIVVQNSNEYNGLRDGVIKNDFNENDVNFNGSLFIIETLMEL